MASFPMTEKGRWSLIFLKLKTCLSLCPFPSDSAFYLALSDLMDFAELLIDFCDDKGL